MCRIKSGNPDSLLQFIEEPGQPSIYFHFATLDIPWAPLFLVPRKRRYSVRSQTTNRSLWYLVLDPYTCRNTTRIERFLDTCETSRPPLTIEAETLTDGTNRTKVHRFPHDFYTQLKRDRDYIILLFEVIHKFIPCSSNQDRITGHPHL